MNEFLFNATDGNPPQDDGYDPMGDENTNDEFDPDSLDDLENVEDGEEEEKEGDEGRSY